MDIEIVQAVALHGGLDIKTVLTLRMCCKDFRDVLTEHMICATMTTDDHPIIWFATLLKEPISFNTLQKLKNETTKGNKIFLTQVLTENVFFDKATHDKIADICLAFEKHTMPRQDTMFHAYLDIYMKAFKMASCLSERQALYDLFIVVCTRALLWVINNNNSVRENVQLYPTIANKLLVSTMQRNIHNNKPRLQNKEDACRCMRLLKAWHHSLTYNVAVFIGINGGIYTLRSDGKRKYW